MTEVAGHDLLPITYGTVDLEYAKRLATTPPNDDRPVWMVNLMKYRDVAQYADGRESTISGQEADDTYAPIGPLSAVGAQIVFLATVDTQLLGDAPQWDRVAVVQYILASETCSSRISPACASSASRTHIVTDAVVFASIRASRSCTSWNRAMGRPNWEWRVA